MCTYKATLRTRKELRLSGVTAKSECNDPELFEVA